MPIKINYKGNSDTSSTDELQVLSLDNGNITLSNGGGTITIPAAELQNLSLTGSLLTLSNGNTVDLAGVSSDNDATNELQTALEVTSVDGNVQSDIDSIKSRLDLEEAKPDNVNDADADATNELQVISITGNTITLSDGGGSITIPTQTFQQLAFSNDILTLSDGGTIDLSGLREDETNELQNLSLIGDKLTISQGNTITIPFGADNQSLSFNPTNYNLSIENGNTLDLSTLAGVSTISAGQNVTVDKTNPNNPIVNVPSLDDADADPTNELQSLFVQGNQLTIEGGNTIILPNTATGVTVIEDEAELRTFENVATPMQVRINTSITITANLTLPEGLLIEFGPDGALYIDTGITVEMKGRVTADPYHYIFTNPSSYPLLHQRTVYANWFGAKPDGDLDRVNWEHTNLDYTKSYHAYRLAALALTHFGQNTEPGEIVFAKCPSGKCYVMHDLEPAQDAPRRAITGSANPNHAFKEADCALFGFLRISDNDGSSQGMILLDNITVRGDSQDKKNTVLMLPNEGVRDHLAHEAGAIGMGVYGFGGWRSNVASAAPYAETVPVGSTAIPLKSAADAATFQVGQKVVIVNGASYYDQQFAQYSKVSAVIGNVVHLEYSIRREMSLNAVSWYGKVANQFTQPAEGAVVQVQLEGGGPGLADKSFSIGSDLYEILSHDGTHLYTVRNVANKGNKAPGTVIPVGTLASEARVIMPADELVENYWVKDMTIVGRRDGLRAGNNILCGCENVHLVHSWTQPLGLALSVDGSLDCSMINCELSTRPGQMESAQIARSATGFKLQNCTIKQVIIEVTEFSNQFQMIDCDHYIDGVIFTKPEYDGIAPLHIGPTSGNTVIKGCRFYINNCKYLVGNNDVQTWYAAAGAGPQITDCNVFCSDVDTLFTIMGPGSRISNINILGSVKRLFSRTGTGPIASDQVSVQGVDRGSVNAYAPGGPTLISDVYFSGQIDQVVGHQPYAVQMQRVRVVREDSYVPGTISVNEVATGSVVAGGRPDEDPYLVQIELDLFGWPVGMDPEVKYEGTLGMHDFIKVRYHRAKVYDANKVFTGVTEDRIYPTNP